MGENKLQSGWEKLNEAINFLKDKRIICRSNSPYKKGGEKKFNSEKNLIEDYFLGMNVPLPFTYSIYLHLRSAFDKKTKSRVTGRSALVGNYEIVNNHLDCLIEETTNCCWNDILVTYEEKKSDSNLIDSTKLALLSGTYVGHYKNKRDELKRFIFIISKAKKENAMLLVGKKIVRGNACLIDGNRLFFVLKTDAKNSPELIICHMGGNFNDTSIVNHFIGISTWYDYEWEKPSASFCVFCKVDKKYSNPSKIDKENYYSKISPELTSKIHSFFNESNGKTFIQLDKHFLT